MTDQWQHWRSADVGQDGSHGLEPERQLSDIHSSEAASPITARSYKQKSFLVPVQRGRSVSKPDKHHAHKASCDHDSAAWAAVRTASVR